jgi:hypothetical protein
MITLHLEIPRTDTPIDPRKYLREISESNSDVRRIMCDVYFSWAYLDIEVRESIMRVRATYIDPDAELISRRLLRIDDRPYLKKIV